MWGHGLHLRLKSSPQAFMVFCYDELCGGGGKGTSLPSLNGRTIEGGYE